jgi:AraC family transcriptional regulator of adaptative response/methylated-DNA-[protein]-cysteine methyltransferase
MVAIEPWHDKETFMKTTALEPAAVATEQDPRWQSVLARDPSADGTFYYSVKTTGVYCFPSCAARPANPRNISFHLTREDAELAGFRPCKRCKPDKGRTTRPRATTQLKFAINKSSLGLVLVAQSDKGLCAVLLGDDPGALQQDLQSRFPRATLTVGDPDFHTLAADVTRLVEAPGRDLDVDLPLDIQGTEFQCTVWQALREIPAGSTMSREPPGRHHPMPSRRRNRRRPVRLPLGHRAQTSLARKGSHNIT